MWTVRGEYESGAGAFFRTCRCSGSIRLMVKAKAWMLDGDRDTANRKAAEQRAARPDDHAAEAELLDKAGVARLLQVS